MTSIAVTASICASASEVALLVASFMPFPPRIWTRLIVACEHAKSRLSELLRNAPRRLLAVRIPSIGESVDPPNIDQ